MLASLSVTEELITVKGEHAMQVAPACSSKEGAGGLGRHRGDLVLPCVAAVGVDAGWSHFRGCFGYLCMGGW